MTLLQTIQQHAANIPDHIALKNGDMALSYRDLLTEVIQSQQAIKECKENYTLAMAMDNHPAWAALDIAAMANQTPLVPLPAFFSDTQTVHAVKDAGASVLITDNPQRFATLFDYLITQKSTITIAGKRLMMMHLNIASRPLPALTAKITYTSGTTGYPKGVCLSEQAMLNVAISIQSLVNLKRNRTALMCIAAIHLTRKCCWFICHIISWWHSAYHTKCNGRLDGQFTQRQSIAPSFRKLTS